MSKSIDIEKVAIGQKMVLYAILINIVSLILMAAVSRVLGLLSFVGLVLAIIGIFTLGAGMGKHTIVNIIYSIMVIIPFLSIIILVLLSSDATKLLQANGYKVGLLGASKQPSQ